KAINGYVVSRANDGVEADSTGEKAALIFVACNADQIVNRVACVNSEQGVERTASGGNRGDAGDRCAPGVPDRFAPGLARMQGFAWFPGRQRIRPCGKTIRSIN